MDAKRIIIVEDDAIIALGLELAAIDVGWDVIGPSATVSGGEWLLGDHAADGAILDANLLDGEVTPLAMALLDRGVPFVVHSANGIPEAVRFRAPDTIVVRKPISPKIVIARLENLIGDEHRHQQIR